MEMQGNPGFNYLEGVKDGDRNRFVWVLGWSTRPLLQSLSTSAAKRFGFWVLPKLLIASFWKEILHLRLYLSLEWLNWGYKVFFPFLQSKTTLKRCPGSRNIVVPVRHLLELNCSSVILFALYSSSSESTPQYFLQNSLHLRVSQEPQPKLAKEEEREQCMPEWPRKRFGLKRLLSLGLDLNHLLLTLMLFLLTEQNRY